VQTDCFGVLLAKTAILSRNRERENIMNKFATIAGLAVAATAMAASADSLLEVDLSVVDQITITATVGNSAADASGSSFTGWLLAGFFNDFSFNADSGGNGIGNLTTWANASSGSPLLFSAWDSFGLNVFNFSADPSVEVIGGSQAFTGSATWSGLDAGEYAAMLAGNISGDIYFNADTDNDIADGAVFIGTWNVIPAPGSMALLGLGGIVAGRRRR